jgi:hypothetical protein
MRYQSCNIGEALQSEQNLEQLDTNNNTNHLINSQLQSFAITITIAIAIVA